MLLMGLLLGCPPETVDEPTLSIVAPADGSTVCGSPLAVELDIENFVLVDLDEGLDPEPGSGHVDVYLNGQSATMASGASFEVEAVTPGEYQLRAELVAADHTALDPYVGAFVYIAVSDGACP